MDATLVLLAFVLFLPLLAWLLRTAFAWRYDRMLRAGMMRAGRSRDPAADNLSVTALERSPFDLHTAVDSSAAKALRIEVTPASALPLKGEADRAFTRATRINHRAQLAVAIACAVNGVVIAAGIYISLAGSIDGYNALALAYLTLAPSIVIAGRVMNLRWAQLMVIVAAYAAGGLALMRLAFPWQEIVRAYSAAAELFALLPMAGVLVLLSRRLRPLIVGLAALLAFVALNFAAAAVLSTFAVVDVSGVRTSIWVLAVAQLVGGVLLVAWLLGRDNWRRPLKLVMAGAALAWIIEWRFVLPVPLGLVVWGLLSHAAQAWLVWMMFRAFLGLWQRGRWSEQIVHSHVATAFVDGYLLCVVVVLENVFPTPWAALSIPVAFVLYALTLHILMRRLRASSTREPPLALLYLRVFSARLGASPLHWLEDRWRRVGRVDLIMGTDVGLEALGPRMFERLMRRRAYGEFVTAPSIVDERLAALPTTMAGDARYPVNAFYCYADTWRAAFERLVAGADVLLMDLREFAAAHRGCAFELATLIREVPLRDIVLVSDARTDLAEIHSIAQEAWGRLPSGSPNAGVSDPVLTLIRLDGPRARHEALLTRRLLAAAFTTSRG